MEKGRLRKIIGMTMTGFGLLQAGFFGVNGDWILALAGLIYAVLGVAYLWAEVYSTDQ